MNGSKIGLIILSLIPGIIFGYIIGTKNDIQFFETHNYSERHVGQDRLTNKLLDFDIPPSHELGDFKVKLESKVNNDINNNRATQISVYFRDLNNGPWIGVNEEEKFIPASLLKIPLMMVYFKTAETDAKILSQKYKYNAAEFPNDSTMTFNKRTTLKDNTEYTIAELIKRMIIYSDNDALRLLAMHIDEKSQKEIYMNLGIKVPSSSLEEFISPRNMSSFLRVLYNTTYLNEEMSEKSLQLLTQTKFDSGLTAGVPKDVLVAQKYGERETDTFKELHDCGIIYYPKHPYILCIMTKGNDYNTLATIIKEISQLTYEQVGVSNQ